jgi:hypothetical protein
MMKGKEKVKCPKCGSDTKIKKIDLELFGATTVENIKMYSCKCGEEFAIGKMVDAALLTAKNKIKPVVAK